MDVTRLDGLARTISARLTRRTSLGVLAGASLSILGLATPGDARKRKKVTLCFNGQTVQKPKKKAKKLQKQGAVKGACVAPSGCPDGQKACGETCIPNADCCNCTGSDVCENGNCVPLRCGNSGPCTVFVTSQSFLGSDLEGLDGADDICNDFAGIAGLAGTFKAWLSTTDQPVVDRFVNIERAGPYRLVANIDQDGGDPPPLVASSFSELTTCPGGECLQHAILRDEAGGVVELAGVWTGTNADGTAHPDNCQGWTDAGVADQGRIGRSDQINAVWTSNSPWPCNDGDIKRRLYCFQQAT